MKYFRKFLEDWELSFRDPLPDQQRPDPWLDLEKFEPIKRSYLDTVKSNEFSAIAWISKSLGIPEKERIDLIELLARIRSRQIFYCLHTKKKNNGKSRIILEPPPKLKVLQKKISKNLLKDLILRKNNINGFSGGSVPEALTPHLKSNFLVMVDIKNAFPSIKYHHVLNFFSQKKMMFSEDNSSFERKSFFSWYVSRIIAQLCTHFGTLPQGVPTSPLIFNLLFSEIDEDLITFSKNNGLIYTRYADNLFFSSSQKIPWKTREDLLQFVTQKTQANLTLEWHKLKIIKISRDRAIKMLGLNLINGKLCNTRKFKQNLKLLVHHIEWLIAHNEDYFQERHQLAGMWGFAVKESLSEKLTTKIKNIFKNH